MRLLSFLFLTSGAIALCAGCGSTAIETGTGGTGGTAGDGGDVCDALVCMNGGTCVDVDGTAECECATGYEGDECETDTDECPDDSLGFCDADNTASCDGTTPAGSYTCTCNDGYEGDNCETDTDECPDDSLGFCDADNTASCDGTTPAGSYTCTCNDGYEGDNCETDTDECPDDSLGFCDADNTASCDGTTPAGSYTCTCNDGYTGKDCDELDPCPDGDPDSAQNYVVDSNTPIGGSNPLLEPDHGLSISAIPQSPPTNATIATSVTGQLGVSDFGTPMNNALFIQNNETADFAFFEDDEGTLTTARSATEIEITINTFPSASSPIPIDISAFDTEGTEIGTTVSASYTAAAGAIDISALFSEAPIHRVRITATTSSAFNVSAVAFTHECL